MSKSNRLTLFIILSMVLGGICGFVVSQVYPSTDQADQDAIKSFSDNVSLVSMVFLRLIKMIIAPLVISTLVVGISKLGDLKTVGRVGGKSLLWFMSASFISLFLGLVLVNLMEPGKMMQLPLPPADANTGVEATAMTLKNFLEHMFPASVIEAMAKNELLQILIFSLFFGTAVAAIGEKGKPVIEFMDSVAHAMLKLTGFVMNLAPLAVLQPWQVLLPDRASGCWVYTVCSLANSIWVFCCYGSFSFSPHGCSSVKGLRR
ncbi:MAG: hypothetical protein RL220_1421 [Bacteroidota bacterium]